MSCIEFIMTRIFSCIESPSVGGGTRRILPCFQAHSVQAHSANGEESSRTSALDFLSGPKLPCCRASKLPSCKPPRTLPGSGQALTSAVMHDSSSMLAQNLVRQLAAHIHAVWAVLSQAGADASPSVATRHQAFVIAINQGNLRAQCCLCQ